MSSNVRSLFPNIGSTDWVTLFRSAISSAHFNKSKRLITAIKISEAFLSSTATCKARFYLNNDFLKSLPEFTYFFDGSFSSATVHLSELNIITESNFCGGYWRVPVKSHLTERA